MYDLRKEGGCNGDGSVWEFPVNNRYCHSIMHFRNKCGLQVTGTLVSSQLKNAREIKLSMIRTNMVWLLTTVCSYRNHFLYTNFLLTFILFGIKSGTFIMSHPALSYLMHTTATIPQYQQTKQLATQPSKTNHVSTSHDTPTQNSSNRDNDVDGMPITWECICGNALCSWMRPDPHQPSIPTWPRINMTLSTLFDPLSTTF